MAGAEQATVQVKELKVGVPAATALYDENGVVIVGRGILVTSRLIDKLKQRGVARLYTRPAGKRSAGQQRRSAPAAESPLRQDSAEPPANDPAPGQPPVEPAVPAELAAYDREKLRRLESLHALSLQTVERLAVAVQRREPVELSSTDPAIEAMIDELVDDPDPVVASTLRYQADLDLARRCVQFSTLCLAVGVTMNVSPMALRDLGRAALLHDYGLFELPPEGRFPHFTMDEKTRQAYRRHPLVAEQWMHLIGGATFTLSLLVAQVHELMDGSGFPRSLGGRSIHPLARVLSIVDAYLSLTSPPKGHPRVVPCDAVAYMINGVSRGLFAPTAATGLLKTVTLYPIGSLVELSDTTRVRVIRSRGHDYGYPVVQPVSPPGEAFDLKTSGLFVTRPIPALEGYEVRLPESYTEFRQPEAKPDAANRFGEQW